MHADAYFVAAAIPMVVGDLLLGAALTASIVPVFAAPLSQPSAGGEVRRAIAGCFAIVAAASLCLAAALLGGMPWLVRLLSPGFGAQAHAYTVALGGALVWLLPLNAVVLLSSLLLNASSAYLAAASTWLIVNLAFFAVVQFGHPALGAAALVWGPLSGPGLVVPFLLWNLSRAGIAPFAAPDLRSAYVGQALRLGAPLVATAGIGSGLGILMLSHLVLRSLGSGFGEGSVAALGYAFRLYEVPVSLVVATAGTLAFTEIARRLAAEEAGAAVRRCRDLLAWGVIVLVPVACLTILVADTLVRVLFERGAFSREATAATADALRGFAPAILFESILMVGLRVLYALRKPGWAVATGAATLATVAACAFAAVSTGSLLVLAAAVSAGFAVAALLVVTGAGRLLGASLWPPLRDAAVAVVLSGALLAAAYYLRSLAGASLGVDLALVAGFSLAYAAGIALACPGRRSEVAAILRRAGA